MSNSNSIINGECWEGWRRPSTDISVAIAGGQQHFRGVGMPRQRVDAALDHLSHALRCNAQAGDQLQEITLVFGQRIELLFLLQQRHHLGQELLRVFQGVLVGVRTAQRHRTWLIKVSVNGSTFPLHFKMKRWFRWIDFPFSLRPLDFTGLRSLSFRWKAQNYGFIFNPMNRKE